MPSTEASKDRYARGIHTSLPTYLHLHEQVFQTVHKQIQRTIERADVQNVDEYELVLSWEIKLRKVKPNAID